MVIQGWKRGISAIHQNKKMMPGKSDHLQVHYDHLKRENHQSIIPEISLPDQVPVHKLMACQVLRKTATTRTCVQLRNLQSMKILNLRDK